MTQTIARLFDSYDEALAAVNELERSGIPHSHISLIANNAAGGHHGHDHADRGDAAADDAGKGATAGGVVGAAGGLLAGLGLLAIPGLGPVVAAGWLASTVLGAAAGAVAGGAVGGIVGALTNEGVDEHDAHVYAEGVRRGGTLVSVKADDADIARADAILNRFSYVDVRTRGEAYRSSGWTRFDPSAPAYSTDEIVTERARYT